jgi:hypothetical protein
VQDVNGAALFLEPLLNEAGDFSIVFDDEETHDPLRVRRRDTE